MEVGENLDENYIL